jgi:hypothetical protein
MIAPQHQFDEWCAEVEEVDISRARWIRENVEAGRRQLAVLDPHTVEDADDSLENNVLSEIPDDGAEPTEEIIQEVLSPIEDEIYDLLTELSRQGEIDHDPKEGGYRRR